MLMRGIGAEPQEYARLGDRDALAALIATKPDIVKSDAMMMGAVDFGHHDLVQWLLEKGANVNARSSAESRHTALHSAAWNGDLRMAKLLASAGADVNARDHQYNSTPFGWAETSIDVSNNPKCKEVAEYLSRLESQVPS